ncbi:aminotransferase class IV [Segatella albensis]|uniref:aminotransferase class IV n=1 Tax=Segatella albensis TaxID=77768 RepID=UPI00068476AF|nr:aminotransferase class IV [Segatella albensis]
MKLLKKYMCPFIETIRIKDGITMNLDYHLKRLNRTREHFWPRCQRIGADELLPNIPSSESLQKLRVIYNKDIITQDLSSYTRKNIEILSIIEDNTIDYTWKSTDRKVLTSLRAQAPSYADEVIIIKNGCVTDTSYTNICFFDGKEWLTPDTPLLQGTMRRYLLDKGVIREVRIRRKDIQYFKKVSLINAMMELGEIIIPIENIRGI